MRIRRKPYTNIVRVFTMIPWLALSILLVGTACSNDLPATGDTGSNNQIAAASSSTAGTNTQLMTTRLSTIQSTPSPTPSPSPTAAPSPQPTIPLSTGYCAKLAAYLADPAKGQAVGERAAKLNGGEWHNACVFTVSEALRWVGCDIPIMTSYTTSLIRQLKSRGFSICYELRQLQPGDICFTSDASGRIDGDPTHTFIFLGWSEADATVMQVFDNQIYDYQSPYHTRDIGLTCLNGRIDQPKEATALFMRR